MSILAWQNVRSLSQLTELHSVLDFGGEAGSHSVPEIVVSPVSTSV